MHFKEVTIKIPVKNSQGQLVGYSEQRLKLLIPAHILCLGSTGSGKTWWTLNYIKSVKTTVSKPEFVRVIVITKPDSFADYKSADPAATIINGNAPNNEAPDAYIVEKVRQIRAIAADQRAREIAQFGVPITTFILIFDDIIDTKLIHRNEIISLMGAGRHDSIQVMWLAQSMYEQLTRTMDNNFPIKVLFKTTDTYTIGQIARYIEPTLIGEISKGTKYIKEKAKKRYLTEVMGVQYGKIIIDNTS